MLNWILLILMLIIMIIILTWIFAKVFGRGEATDAAIPNQETKDNNARAIANGRVEDIQFDLVARGYRQDQVDAVIEELQAQLAQARGVTATPAPGVVDAEPKTL